MKIQIISDLHREFGEQALQFDQADVIIMAGDIDVGTKGVEWLMKTFPTRPVIYVLGNHEYYGESYPKTLHQVQEIAKGSNIHVLENTFVDIEHVRFHGATLWTDFALYGNPYLHAMSCQRGMNDFWRIKHDETGRNILPMHTLEAFEDSKKWLHQSLAESDAAIDFVVTHHGISEQSIAPQYKNDPLSTAFASNLEPLILEHQPAYWVYGHTHFPTRFFIDKTDVICNPQGYPHEDKTGFELELLVTL